MKTRLCPDLRLARLRPWCSALLWASPLLLTACSSSVPLPAWPDKPSAAIRTPAAPQAKRSGAAAPSMATPPGAPAVAIASPVSSNQLQAAGAMPYGAAVAARFPEPAVRYATPGLQDGRSHFSTNGEIGQWLRAVADRTGPGTRSALLPLGQSQNGEPLHALLLTRASATDAATLLAAERPTVLLVGQQHGDEPAGAEALLVLARELGTGLLEPLLERINVIIVPRANPDGAERGKRVTVNGLDMNRDHLLLMTPEARALAQLAREYQPAVVIDAHEYTVAGRFLQKFGAIQRFDGLLQYTTTGNTPEFITKAAEEWYRRPIVAALNEQKLSNEWYYTTSNDPQDLWVSMGGTRPDTGRNVYGLRNAISLLLETRGIGLERQHIQRRVHTHATALNAALKVTAERAGDLQKLLPFVRREVASQACQGQAVVDAGPTPGKFDLLMLDPETGADRVLKVDWNSSLVLQVSRARARPCGYWLAPSASAAVDRLKLLGLQVLQLNETGSVLGETYRETERSEGVRKDVRGTVAAGKPIAMVDVKLMRSLIDMPAGSYYVPLSQPLANLALAALEPDTQSSFYANGILEQLEQSARVMAEPSLAMQAAP